MTAPFEGGCLCGALRYLCADEPLHTFICHCLDCQKESGGPFATELYVTRDSLRLTGETRRYSRIGDSGLAVHRHFCPVCGSVLLTRFDSAPDHVCIKACSLDDPSWLVPQFHLYVRRKQPWLTIADGLPQYDGDF